MPTESEDKPRRSYGGILLIVSLVVLPVLYFLSTGPARWLVVLGLIPKKFLNVYEPIDWLGRLFPLIKRLVNWYLDLWM